MKVKGSMQHEKDQVSGLWFGHDVFQKSGKHPCAVFCNGVGSNSILSSQCMLWVHKTCSGITKQLIEDPNYICPRCKGESQPIDGRTATEVDVEGTMT